MRGGQRSVALRETVQGGVCGADAIANALFGVESRCSEAPLQDSIIRCYW